MASTKGSAAPKGTEIKTTSSSLKANSPSRKIEGRKFEDISVTLDLPTPKRLGESDNASTELLKKRAELHALRVGHRKRIRALVAFVYGVALFLKANEVAWIRFTQHEQWESTNRGSRPEANDRSDALRYALRFAVGPTGSAASKRVSKYYLALVTWFDKDISAEQVLTRIRLAGGFDAMARKRAEKKAKAKTSPMPSTVAATKPVGAGPRKSVQAATVQRADLAVGSGEVTSINILLENTKDTELLLKAKNSDRLKMIFRVNGVRGRTVNISDVIVGFKKRNTPD